MRTVLRLCPRNSRDYTFYHLLDEDIDKKVGDILNFNLDYYDQLNKDEVKAFQFEKLEIGQYKVISVYQTSDIYHNDRQETVRNLLLQLI